MRNKHIPNEDNLFRSCIHPTSFKSKGRLFESKKLFFPRTDPDERTLLGSLAWERYVPTTKHVHAYGCRVASFINERSRSSGRVGRKIYCGAYQLNAGVIRALAAMDGLSEVSSADVEHRIENKEIAHANLRISLKPGDFDVEDAKTAIVDYLWHRCFGPLRYVDAGDQDINPHPSSNLVTPPAGPYSDTRSCVSRLWSLIRFRIYYCIWRSFCQNATK
jgi:hypothetical protein